MNYRKLLIIWGIILLLSGCSDFMMICSLNPFYLEKNVIVVPEIEGNWRAHPVQSKSEKDDKNNTNWEQADSTSIWQIRRFISQEKIKTKKGRDSIVTKPQNYYEVLLTGNKDSARYQFGMVLFRINGALYADFCPSDIPSLEKSRMAKENHFTVHTLARVTIGKTSLHMSWLGANYMKDMIEQKRVRIKYRWVSDAKRLLLTASPQELTEMLERYAHQKRFIDWDSQPARILFTPVNQ